MIKKNRLVASGIIHMHPRGFGFVTPHKEYDLKEDIFIPQRKSLNAIEGDEVEFRYYPQRGPKGLEGEVIAILKRSRRHVAGILDTPISPTLWRAYVPLFGPEKELIAITESSAKRGDRMVFEITSWGGPQKSAKGKATTFLGEILDGCCDIPAAVEEFELIDTFSQRVAEEIKAIGTRIPPKELKKRVDFTHLETFTIDPDESKDFDDALSLLVTKGGYQLYVHIADVSHYVKPDTSLDQEALARCNSVYFPGGVLPMLPPALSNNLCSLKPKVNRLAVSVVIDLNKEGVVQKYEYMRSVIKSKTRFTYRKAKEVLEGKRKSSHSKTLHNMVTLCKKLKAQRAARGAVEFAMPDLSIKIDAEGKIAGMHIIEYDITHQMVEEFMLKANELIALTLYKQGKPLTYRIHEEPNPEKMRDFALYAQSFGFKVSPKPTSEELQELFDQTRECSFGKALTTAFIRTMKLASYSTQNIGHFGLMLDHYTHFTSPIRRYVDLIVHRLLFDESNPALDHERMATLCSEKERSSARAESSVTLLKKLRYLFTIAEENPHPSFEAIITGVKPFGLSFEIPALFLDGFIPLHEIETEMTYHKKRQKMVSKEGEYLSGSTIQVTLLDVNLIRRSAHWGLKKKSPQKRKNKKR